MCILLFQETTLPTSAVFDLVLSDGECFFGIDTETKANHLERPLIRRSIQFCVCMFDCVCSLTMRGCFYGSSIGPQVMGLSQSRTMSFPFRLGSPLEGAEACKEEDGAEKARGSRHALGANSRACSSSVRFFPSPESCGRVEFPSRNRLDRFCQAVARTALGAEGSNRWVSPDHTAMPSPVKSGLQSTCSIFGRSQQEFLATSIVFFPTWYRFLHPYVPISTSSSTTSGFSSFSHLDSALEAFGFLTPLQYLNGISYAKMIC